MSLKSRVLRRGQPPAAPSYRRRILAEVHHLIGQGFQSISQGNLQDCEETAITGRLVNAIEGFLDDPQSPAWTERYFVQDERHLNDDPKREGKRRARVDIEFSYSGVSPRPKFEIEAKRLREPRKKSLKAYLGQDGLGCFLQQRYAKHQSWAGMMAYVQSGDVAGWKHQISSSLTGDTAGFLVEADSEVFAHQRLDDLLPDVFQSDHFCQSRKPSKFVVHHIFLNCC